MDLSSTSTSYYVYVEVPTTTTMMKEGEKNVMYLYMTQATNRSCHKPPKRSSRRQISFSTAAALLETLLGGACQLHIIILQLASGGFPRCWPIVILSLDIDPLICATPYFRIVFVRMDDTVLRFDH
ncbi:hypothetical protein F4804DRAFT_266299 [Jackrogersella minutella]|nr:hypothetical protein F4804DRAFT_266299 [Jackrogersella minutella]